MLTLQPVSYEELHRDPDLTIFYNVISDAEIEELKEFASERVRQVCLCMEMDDNNAECIANLCVRLQYT